MSEAAPFNPQEQIPQAQEAALEKQPKFDFEELKQTLTTKVELMQKQFQVKHRNLISWATRQGYALHFLSENAGKAVVSAGLVGSLLAGTPGIIAHPDMLPGPDHHGQTSSISISQNAEGNSIQLTDNADTIRHKDQLTVAAMQQKEAEQQQQIMAQLLTASQQGTVDATALSQQVSQLTSVPAVAVLDGYQLNTYIGRIGAEQHLRLYPGQDLGDHFASPQERLAFQSSGFAPGNGAWGAFAPSKAQVTPEIIEREKYYVAIQTFASPNWAGNVNQAYNWFKYRKVIVYHPITQKAVVAVVGDAGPALSTGKNYGGSPEVMSALSTYDGYGSPPVMMFFVDDPDNTIPLGPVNFKTVVTGG